MHVLIYAPSTVSFSSPLQDILPGFVLCEPSLPCHVGSKFEAQIVILEHKSIICAGYGAVLHIHNVVEEVQITVRASISVTTT